MSYWIIVVDDDAANLRMAGHILSKNDMRVTALRSGQALLDMIAEKGQPDLILLDINMPEMDGFETLERLRILENRNGIEETPVIFLTADEESETETHGFEAGVSDYIKKPFNPDILLRRINNIVSRQDRIKSLRTEASTDKLTGMLNKSASGGEMSHMCSSAEGCLMMIDLDSFKLVNDLYGHEMGDKVLVSFSEILKDCIPDGSKCARVGGDEFTAFCTGMTTPESVKAFAKEMNVRITAEAKRLMGEDMEIPLGVSIGGVAVPEYGRDYETLLPLADKALYSVKQNGKHGAELWSDRLEESSGIDSIEKELAAISAVVGERNIPNSALRLDKQIFSSVYQYIMRYIVRNRRKACKALFTLSRMGDIAPAEFEDLCTDFGEHIKNCLRKSDIFMRCRHDQYFVLLTDIREDAVSTVTNNIIAGWYDRGGKNAAVSCATEFVGGAASGIPDGEARIIAAGSDVAALRSAGQILSGGGFFVTAVKTDTALFDMLKKHTPQLLLIDSDIPTGAENVLNRLREAGGDTADIPVLIMLPEKGGSCPPAAADAVRKPLEAGLLLKRARNICELAALRRRMSIEVEKRLRGGRDLFMSVIRSFSELIDAKDNRSGGYSLTVAECAREIAARAGLSARRQNDIYMAALLHDVGKLGIPDEVIGKPSALTKEEFEIIKGHSELGAHALESINAMPVFAAGARWHHERYEGGGYPDGLAGDDIPLEARIIAVADAYAAMSTPRSYRPALAPEQITAELRKGSGTQFDPVYAEILINMIENDGQRQTGKGEE